jgi:hypothetical protein
MNDLRTCGKCHTAMAESFFSKHRSKYNKACDACLSLPAKPAKPPKVKPPKVKKARKAKAVAIEPVNAVAMPAKPAIAIPKERSDLINFINDNINSTARTTRKSVLSTILNTSASDRIKTTGDGSSMPYSILSDQTLSEIKEIIDADPSFTIVDPPFID